MGPSRRLQTNKRLPALAVAMLLFAMVSSGSAQQDYGVSLAYTKEGPIGLYEIQALTSQSETMNERRGSANGKLLRAIRGNPPTEVTLPYSTNVMDLKGHPVAGIAGFVPVTGHQFAVLFVKSFGLSQPLIPLTAFDISLRPDLLDDLNTAVEVDRLPAPVSEKRLISQLKSKSAFLRAVARDRIHDARRAAFVAEAARAQQLGAERQNSKDIPPWDAANQRIPLKVFLSELGKRDSQCFTIEQISNSNRNDDLLESIWLQRGSVGTSSRGEASRLNDVARGLNRLKSANSRISYTADASFQNVVHVTDSKLTLIKDNHLDRIIGDIDFVGSRAELVSYLNSKGAALSYSPPLILVGPVIPMGSPPIYMKLKNANVRDALTAASLKGAHGSVLWTATIMMGPHEATKIEFE